jgi:enolase-phosphatase E1
MRDRARLDPMTAVDLAGARAVLLDIEGTISPASFVHDVLFPLAAARLPAFVAAHAREPEIAAALELAKGGESLDEPAVVDRLLGWIRSDTKHPALKTLQGLVWAEAYASGAVVAPLYADVAPALDRWRVRGVELHVYSSGSVLAQQLFFRHTDAGDLAPRVGRWFDLATGPKVEAASYRAIAAALGLAPRQIVFFTDSVAEVAAALEAGVRAVHVVRPGDDARVFDAGSAAHIEAARAAPRVASFDGV